MTLNRNSMKIAAILNVSMFLFFNLAAIKEWGKANYLKLYNGRFNAGVTTLAWIYAAFALMNLIYIFV